jgi:DnaK suppressor protein
LLISHKIATLEQLAQKLNKQMVISTDRIRTRLLALKQETESLSALSARGRKAVRLDQQSVGRLSRMDAMQQQAMAQAQERNRAITLVRIDQALKRLDDGEYGYCLSCGEEIPEKRLEIDPTATHCVACKGG